MRKVISNKIIVMLVTQGLPSTIRKREDPGDEVAALAFKRPAVNTMDCMTSVKFS